MFWVDDNARLILDKAEKMYRDKFANEMPILSMLKTKQVDKREAERILKVVQGLNKTLPDYGDRIY